MKEEVEEAEPSEMREVFDFWEPFDPPPPQTMQGRSLMCEQVFPCALQKFDPPFAHSVPSHCPLTVTEDCEDARAEERELRERSDVIEDTDFALERLDADTA